MKYYIIQFFLATFATLGFTMYYKVPKKTIVTICIVSGLMWVLYEYNLKTTHSYLKSGFIASFAIGIAAEICAYFYKKPATLFSLPCLIPIVPGAGMYYIMYYFIENDYEQMNTNLIQTLLVAAALSMGIVFSQAAAKFIKRIYRRYKELKNKGAL